MTNDIRVAGPWFEDFIVGQEFDAPSVAVTSGYASLYQSMTADRQRMPLDHYVSAKLTGCANALVHPMLAINIAIGQSTWASQRVKANLFYRGLVLRAPLYLGDSLYTRTRVVGLRQNRRQAGRAATGMVALELLTTNQHDEVVLQCWRCPMIPCRDANAETVHADALDTLGATPTPNTLAALLPAWDLSSTAAWSGLRADQLADGTVLTIEARDTITSAPELVRLTLNMAMAHTDASLSYLGERLVYGGHTIALAHAQLTRALPNILTLLAWESCEHTAPVLENDRLRSVVTILGRQALAAGRGALLRLKIETHAARGAPEQESKVLEWILWVWSL